VAVCSAVVNHGLDSRLFLKSLHWAIMAHQVLEQVAYNIQHKNKQGVTKLLNLL